MNDPSVTFESMPGHWAPAATSAEIPNRSTHAVIVDTVPIVLFRGSNGQISALVDRCPHRGTQLSGGTRDDDGCLTCPFHGWRFDAKGQCLSTPLDGTPRSSRMRAQRVPSFECAGLVWVFTEVRDDDPPRPRLPAALTEPGWHGHILTRHWDAHWSRAIQTMLDVAHIPFVHRWTIGGALGRAVGRSRDARLEMSLERQDDGGFELRWGLLSGRDAPKDTGWLQFLPPNGVIIPLPLRAPRIWRLFIWCTPTSPGQSRQFVVPRRNFGLRINPVWWLADKLNALVLAEDRPNVEGIWPSEVPAPGVEISVPSDKPTIAFATYYHRRVGRAKRSAVPAR
ncbi:MAG: Rieske 2Fe-2S domain-containing protein [Myxococcota bacterium]